MSRFHFHEKEKAPLPGAEHSSACGTLAGAQSHLNPGWCPFPVHNMYICMRQASDHHEDDFLTNSGWPELRNEGGKKTGNGERGTERNRNIDAAKIGGEIFAKLHLGRSNADRQMRFLRI